MTTLALEIERSAERNIVGVSEDEKREQLLRAMAELGRLLESCPITACRKECLWCRPIVEAFDRIARRAGFSR